MVSRHIAFIALLGLAACASAPVSGTRISDVRFADITLPQGVARSNQDLASDFIDLTFALENGEQLTELRRYEQPVRVYLRSPSLEPYRRDLEAVLNRLRVEAGIDIAQTGNPAEAQIFIEAVPAARIARVFPTAACFIVPGETDWRGFQSRRSGTHVRWADQKTLGKAAIFLPPDTTPQDVRDCLNEEITQALGPANDLYRLPDSIWNDDNFHGMATRFDMTILRTLYQPELHSGMTKPEVVKLLPKVLNQTNPLGRSVPARPRAPESRVWAEAIEAAQARDASRAYRANAALLATEIAAEMRPIDHRLGVSLLTLGRLNLRRDPVVAAKDFADAYALFRAELGLNDVRTAQAGVHLAALSVGTGQYDLAILLSDRHVPDAIAGQNAILVASFLSIEAEALAESGLQTEAEAARLDSLRWARYGFGDADGTLGREQAQLTQLLLSQEK